MQQVPSSEACCSELAFLRSSHFFQVDLICKYNVLNSFEHI
jgi:hypothetical protein